MKRKFLHKAGLLLVVLLTASLVLPACVDGDGDITNPDTFVQATIGDADTMDPAYAYDTASGEQIQTIYEPLIFYDGASTT